MQALACPNVRDSEQNGERSEQNVSEVNLISSEKFRPRHHDLAKFSQI